MASHVALSLRLPTILALANPPILLQGLVSAMCSGFVGVIDSPEGGVPKVLSLCRFDGNHWHHGSHWLHRSATCLHTSLPLHFRYLIIGIVDNFS